MSRLTWWDRVAFVRLYALSRPDVVFHRAVRRSEGPFAFGTRAQCGLTLSDWSAGHERAPATTYMLLTHAVKIGRPCARCYPNGVA